MHGMINRVIERFSRDTYGRDFWIGVAQRLELESNEFEPMLTYEAELTEALLDEIASTLGKARDEVLEDIGTYLVSHPNVEALRRLLRFGGVSFMDFLHSLDDLPGRARLAVPDLEMPELELRQYDQGLYCLTSRGLLRDSGHLMLGVLSAMADDYGSLVLLGHDGGDGAADMIRIELLDTAHSEGRSFSLAGGGGAAP